MSPAEIQQLQQSVAALRQVGVHINAAAQSILAALQVAEEILDAAQAATRANGATSP